ncbi:hypothetical protein NDU88_007911 [Pleurodeles waltl]|uniref:Uncharacterized protein n=1 Tax=Pleurodeles waltl TaxID=8319 RepID=A0AAV7QT89_PLEWA|nr:hypothetical protein NDU88_007911 [Pleurodeles waltl]
MKTCFRAAAVCVDCRLRRRATGVKPWAVDRPYLQCIEASQGRTGHGSTHTSPRRLRPGLGAHGRSERSPERRPSRPPPWRSGGEELGPACGRAQLVQGSAAAGGLQVRVTALETGPCLFYCGENQRQRHRQERSGAGAPRLFRLHVADAVTGVRGVRPELEGCALTEEAP